MRVMRVPEREVATRGGRGGSPSDDGDCERMDASGICQERFSTVSPEGRQLTANPWGGCRVQYRALPAATGTAVHRR